MLSSFVSTAFEDVLSGLPTSEQPYVHELRRGPSRARCSRFPATPCLHRSDRSAQGFAGVDRFDDRPRVLAYSSVLVRFCVNTSTSCGVGYPSSRWWARSRGGTRRRGMSRGHPWASESICCALWDHAVVRPLTSAAGLPWWGDRSHASRTLRARRPQPCAGPCDGRSCATGRPAGGARRPWGRRRRGGGRSGGDGLRKAHSAILLDLLLGGRGRPQVQVDGDEAAKIPDGTTPCAGAGFGRSR